MKNRKACNLGVVPCALLMVIHLAATCVPAAAQTYFYKYGNFATGNNPSSFITADFNGDGKTDLAVTNYTDNTVSILLGKADGTFAPQTVYATGNNPVALVAGDFNGDGKLDLAVVNDLNANNPNGVGSVSILLGNGDGTFRSHVDYPTGNSPVGIVAGDFNGDGKTDLAVVNTNSRSVSLLFGRGDGTFQDGTPLATLARPIQIRIADFNGDGKPDIILLNNSPNGIGAFAASVSVFLNLGNGNFSRADTQLSSSSNAVLDFAVADFNGDGRPDIAVTTANSIDNVWVLFGTGSGTFTNLKSLSLNFQANLIIATDFNHDEKADLAVSSSPNFQPVSIALIPGNGDGTFAPPVNVNVGQTPTSFVIQDLNGDGQDDIALVGNLSSVSVLLGNANGMFGNRLSLPLATNSGPTVVGDFNRDGKPDIAVAGGGSPAGRISVLLGNGNGTFQSALYSPLGSSGVTAMVLGDFNGDGIPDIAVINSNATSFSVFLGNGDGTFQPPITTSPPIAPGVELFGLAASDLNGDGKADLALVAFNLNGTDVETLIYLSNGNGTFRLDAQYVTSGLFDPPFSSPSIIAADFNHDGKPDLAITNGQSHTISVFLGNGDGTFQSPKAYATGLLGPTNLAAADFNGDGNVDLAVSGQNGLSVLPGKGDGTFGAPIVNNIGVDLGQITVADFSKDGKPDLGISAANGTLAFLFIGNGDGSFQAPVTLPVPGPLTVAAGDFNSNGFPDLLASTGPGPGAGASVLFLFFSAPVPGLFPTALSFGPQSLGSSSHPRMVTFGNSGNAALSISKIQTTGSFFQTNTCSVSLAPLESCTINVTFSPQVSGTQTGMLTIFDNASPGTQSSLLSGTGATNPGAPVVSSFSPSSGVVGTKVVITGSAFTGATRVTFNGTSAATFAVVSDMQLTASVPSGATSGPITVMNAAGSGTSTASFHVLARINSFTPTKGTMGTNVTITGTSFTGATRVAFSGSAASYTLDSDTQITASVPGGAMTGRITVTTPAGTAYSASSTPFTVLSTATPTITSFTPTKGSTGTTVTLTGTNFTGTTGISFNGTRATAISGISDSQVKANVPSGATTGPISVTNTLGTATSASSFTVMPHINSFTPTKGTMGTNVAITGTSFTGATRVTFSGLAASYTLDSDTQITASVPGGAMTGRITVTTPAGTAYSASGTPFTVLSTATPTITSFTPTKGSTGITVTLTGTNFTGTTGISFNGTRAIAISGISDSQVKANVPSGATTGPISVTNTLGTATSGSNFTVN